MPLSPGTRIGPYEVTASIGAGGMGEVYRATDTNLKRSVAIKVLPDEVATDAERLARFRREAEMLARLNHPNIAHIHGIERSGTTTALVMELVDGHTLADRIRKGPVAVTETVAIAKQIALALEAAHEQGIIHRDLKPANVKIAADDIVKVLDFGLAKAAEGSDSSGHSNVANSPTITSPAMTAMGLILGTAAYMAPEQAKGQRVDKRADVWAFGCVLYEMLTGARAFSGDDVSDTLASVLKTNPSWQKLPADVPTALRTLVDQCLEKDRRKRLGDISGALFVLNNLTALSGASLISARGAEPTSSSRRLMPALAPAAAVLAVVALVAAFFMGAFERRPEPAPTTRLTLLLPPDRGLSISGMPNRSVAVSPDGTQVVYVGLNPAQSGERGSQLRVRPLGSFEVRDLPGTFAARQPFFSPDGRWVGFFTTGGELKKIALATGNPVNIVTGLDGSMWGHAVWLPNNTIVYSTPGITGLMKVSADGGTPQPFVAPTPSEDFMFPMSFIPDSASLLIFVAFGTSQIGNIDAVHLDTGERTKILQSVGSGFATASGHLVFSREDTMFAAAFDRRRLSIIGEAVPLTDGVRRTGLPQLAFSTTGLLAYVPAEGGSERVIGGARGSDFATLGIPPGALGRPRISPDGQRVIYSTREGGQWSLQLRDLTRSTTTELVQADFETVAAWHPGGQAFAFIARRSNRQGIYLRELGGGEQSLLEQDGANPLLRLGSFSPDGATLAYVRQTAAQHEIWKLTVSDHRTEKLVQTASSVHSPAFSPDGRLLAYVSGPSSTQDVTVIDLQTRATAVVGRGSGPVWDRKGATLYFMAESAGEPVIMAASVSTAGGTLRLGAPSLALKRFARTETGASVQYAGSNNAGPGYDVFPDGRFAVVRAPDPRDAREIVVVQNWFEELGRLAPTK